MDTFWNQLKYINTWSLAVSRSGSIQGLIYLHQQLPAQKQMPAYVWRSSLALQFSDPTFCRKIFKITYPYQT
jgi:hypothetical protein